METEVRFTDLPIEGVTQSQIVDTSSNFSIAFNHKNGMFVLSKEKVCFNDGIHFNHESSNKKKFIGFGGSITKTGLVAFIYPMFLTRQPPWKPNKPAVSCCSWLSCACCRRKSISKPLEMYK